MKARIHRKCCRVVKGLALLCMALSFTACIKKQAEFTPNSCFTGEAQANSGSSGAAYAFLPDPMLASKNANLSPTSTKLDDYRKLVALQNLKGTGVLLGRYVDVRDGLSCNEGYAAYSDKNTFKYQHSDPHFQEAMSYYFGDEYFGMLARSGVSAPEKPVRIVTHCMMEDNAYYTRARSETGEIIDKVCLGDSVSTPGASYADDGIVAIHELQHASTARHYNANNPEFNRFEYDEAGALNEAISDFLALVYSDPLVPSGFDPKIFGRWALGTYYGDLNAVRGAAKCPQYDAAYGTGCSNFPNFNASSDNISFVYPDGMGWTFAKNTNTPYPAAAFNDNYELEEIHNNGILVTGALWDVYEYLKSSYDQRLASMYAVKLVHEAIKHLPMWNSANLSPITFTDYARDLVDYATAVGLSSADASAIAQRLQSRGLYNAPQISDSSWAAVGPGSVKTPGLRIIDDPSQLKQYVDVPQDISTGLNGRVDAGEVFALWFDIQNNSPITAGGALLKITSLDSDKVMFFGSDYNWGMLSKVPSNQVQIRYAKINGSNIVSALTVPANPGRTVTTGNSYFKTNPRYTLGMRTAVLAQASKGSSGSTARFQVEVIPANGVSSTVIFNLAIK